MSDEKKTSSLPSTRELGSYVLPVAIGGVAVLAVPPVLWAVGFKAGGIVAGSWAAKLMSASAIANGGGVVSGGAVAVAQSVGAAGLSGTASAVIGTGTAATTAGIQKLCSHITANSTPESNLQANQSKGPEQESSVWGLGSKAVEITGTGLSVTASGIKSAGGYIVGMVNNDTVRSGVAATSKDLQKFGGKVAELATSGSDAVGSGVVSVAGSVKKLVVGENKEEDK